MKTPGRSVLMSAVTLVSCLALAAMVVAGMRAMQDFEADEAVETITLRIDVGADGENLSEPVYLDLGLGVPLWLHPLGREESERAPFGVTPTRADVAHEVPAGSSATFTFSASDQIGMDTHRTGVQLLNGVQISDISRVGFASAGDINWVLTGYEISINGKPFATRNAINAASSLAHDKSHTRLSEIAEQTEPLTSEADDLRALAEAGFPLDDADSARLTELIAQLDPLLVEHNRLQRTIDGSHPWFVDPEFESLWRTDAVIREAKVTLVTAAHTGADTSNYVYFQTGGHKYVVGSPVNRLLPDFGPQEIRLDLLAGPLSAADLRGYSVGMLAHDQPTQDRAPDRWHPQRMIVELDDRVVYDSDDSELDRLSLEAIRIIPPVHRDQDGSVIVNTPGPREAHVWQAGTGVGLDLVRGGAAELPAEGDPAYPEAEPPPDGLYDPLDLISAAGIDVEVTPWDEEFSAGFDPGYPYFPGEEEFGPGWFPAEPWFDPGFDPWHDPELWPDPAFDPWEPAPGWMDMLFDLLTRFGVDVDEIEETIEEEMEEIEADPVGDPVQIDDIRWDLAADSVSGLVIPQGVTWTVSGDESMVDGYEVEVLAFRPHLPAPACVGESLFSASVLAGEDAVAISSETIDGWLTDPIHESQFVYLLPLVTPRLTGIDPEATEPGRFGPAHPMRPSDPELQVETLLLGYIDRDGILGTTSVSVSGDPPYRRAAWLPNVVETHMGGFTFGGPAPGYHVVLRPEDGDAELMFMRLEHDDLIEGRSRFVAHCGFLGGMEDVTNDAEFQIRFTLIPDGGVDTHVETGWIPLSTSPDDPHPLQAIERMFDPDLLFPGAAYRLSGAFLQVRGGDLSETSPPVFIGVRLLAVDD